MKRTDLGKVLDELAGVAERWKEAERPRTSPFNAFLILGDRFRHEHFHTRMLFMLLARETGHQSRDLLTRCFLHTLCRCWEKSAHTNDSLPPFRDWKPESVEVRREVDSIDLRLVHGGESIVVENKINGAMDQPKQLPRYVNSECAKHGRRVVAVVYLTLDALRIPSMSEWNEPDREMVLSRFVPVQAVNGQNGLDLASSWLLSAEALIADRDELAVVRQYRLLLLSLGRAVMDQTLLDDFVRHLADNDEYVQAAAISDMWVRMPEYLARSLGSRIEQRLHNGLATSVTVQYAPPSGGDGHRVDIYLVQEAEIALCAEVVFGFDGVDEKPGIEVSLWQRLDWGTESSLADAIRRRMNELAKDDGAHIQAHPRWGSNGLVVLRCPYSGGDERVISLVLKVLERLKK